MHTRGYKRCISLADGESSVGLSSLSHHLNEEPCLPYQAQQCVGMYAPRLQQAIGSSWQKVARSKRTIK